MIKVWGRATSSNVQCVIWCLEELGLEYERVDAGLMYGVTDTPEYLAMNPNGTVPTLQDGNNIPLFESAAIVRYLANRYATDPFWPSDVVARAEVDCWAEWSKVSVQMIFSFPIFWPTIRMPADQRDDERLAASIAKFEKALAMAEARLAKHKFLVNDDFTVADIQFGHILFRYFDIDIKRAELPNVKRYYQMLTEMPHYKKHVMVNYDELRAS